MSHAAYCGECDAHAWPPVDAEGPGGQTEITACRLALKHVRETGHTDVRITAGCYYVGDGERPTSFEGPGVDADEVRVPDRSKMANTVAGAARRLRDTADSLEKWEEPDRAARTLRKYAEAVESNIPEDEEADVECQT